MADRLSEAEQVAAQRAAVQNRARLAGPCGCFHCLARFDAGQVIAWTDAGQTALCPVCGMDAVVPGPYGRPQLAQLKRRWFKDPPHDAPGAAA